MIKKTFALIAAIGLVATVPFTDSILAGNTLVRDSIQSEGYVPGSTGWSINRDGTAEFNTVTSRGEIIIGDYPNGNHAIGGGVDSPNGWAFYSANAEETAPAEIEAVDQGTLGLLMLRSPQMNAGSQATLSLQALQAAFGNTTKAQISAHNISLGTFGGATDKITVNQDLTRLSETWHTVGAAGEPAFAPNWAVQGGSAVGFFKDATGRVQLRGRATEPVALSATIFTLPVGYRPTQSMSWAVKANNDAGTVGWVTVTTAGAVTCTGNVAALRVQTILDAISFPTF